MHSRIAASAPAPASAKYRARLAGTVWYLRAISLLVKNSYVGSMEQKRVGFFVVRILSAKDDTGTAKFVRQKVLMDGVNLRGIQGEGRR